jgi:hypothetical protein
MMLPDLNTISDYTFTTEFTSLNGIYLLTELITYNQAIANGVDFVKSLYTPAGVASSQFATDAPNYVNDTVLVITPANTTGGTTLYVPQSILAMMPDSMVGCYNNMAIGINLGLFDDQTQINWVISELNQILMSALGITNPAILYSLGSQYMKISDYNEQAATRAAAATGYNTLFEQLQAQLKLTQQAQNLVADYEQTLIALNGA